MSDLVNNPQDEKMKFLQGLILLAQEEGQHHGGRTKESSDFEEKKPLDFEEKEPLDFEEYEEAIMPSMISLNRRNKQYVNEEVVSLVNQNHEYLKDQQAPFAQYQKVIKNALACLQGEKNYQKFKIALEDVKRISQTRVDYPRLYQRLLSEFFFRYKYGNDSPAQLLQKRSDAVLQADASGGNRLISISQEVQEVPNVVCTVITNLRAQKELNQAEQKSNEVKKDSAAVGPVWSDKKNTFLQILENRISKVDSIVSTPSGVPTDVPTLASLCEESDGHPGAQNSEILSMASKDVARKSLNNANEIE